MSNHEFNRYPQVAYLLMRESFFGNRFRVYTSKAFAFKARGSSGVIFELPLPAFETLKIVES